MSVDILKEAMPDISEERDDESGFELSKIYKSEEEFSTCTCANGACSC
jgi:hypothetical protein